DERWASHAPKLTKADGTVRFDQPANMVRARVHGLMPWPGCWIHLGEQSVRLHRVEVAQTDEIPYPPCTIMDDMTIACQPGSIRVLEIQPVNGALMAFEAYRNGHRL